MRIAAIFAGALSLSLLACSGGEERAPSASQGSGKPQRIVSLDYCADQYVLRFADRADILALSIDADKRFSYLREEAKGLRKVRPRAADVLALEPDLIVRSYGGGPNVAGFMGRAGVPVVQIGFPHNIDEVRGEVLRIGKELGESEEAREVVESLDRRLAVLTERGSDAPKALYMTPGGVTAGEGTLIHELMVAAGLANFHAQPGWSPIPLERLAYERPELVVAAFFESQRNDINNWSAIRHPVAEAQMRELPVASLDGAWTACGGWFLIDAVEAMSQAARDTS